MEHKNENPYCLTPLGTAFGSLLAAGIADTPALAPLLALVHSVPHLWCFYGGDTGPGQGDSVLTGEIAGISAGIEKKCISLQTK